MSQALASPSACCSPCDETVNVAIPGPQGEPGADGTNGTDGLNAFTDLTAAFTQPGVSASAVAEVTNSDWAVVGQDAFLEGGGYYNVIAVADSTHVEIENLGYNANSVPTTIIPIGISSLALQSCSLICTNNSAIHLHTDNTNLIELILHIWMIL